MPTSAISRAGSPRLCRFEKDRPVYFQNDPASHCYTVMTGVARTCRYHHDGQRQITGFYYPRDVFGVDGTRYSETAEAVIELTCMRVGSPNPAGVIDEAEPHDPGSTVDEMLRQALDCANRSIFLFGRRTALERLAAFILITAERVGEFDEVNLAMCRTDIADYLGLTIHTVSRTLSQLCLNKLIALDGPQRFRITDLRGIRALAGDDVWQRIADAGQIGLCPNTFPGEL